MNNCILWVFLNNLYPVYFLVQNVVPPMALNSKLYPRASLFFLPNSVMHNQALLFLGINNSPNILVTPKIVHSCQLLVSVLTDEKQFQIFCTYVTFKPQFISLEIISDINNLCYTCLLFLLALYLMLATMILGFQGHSLNLLVHIYKLIYTYSYLV